MTAVSHEPRTGRVLATVRDSTPGEVAAAVAAASSAAPRVAGVPPHVRADWLDAVADAVDAHADELARLADSETALGLPRLLGEVARVAAQLRFYARVAVDGSYLGVAIDEATATAPRLVRANLPLGPVAVFGASNFPFAFGVLGNDTASALAAGCPVIAKAHPAHVATCLRLDEIARTALAGAGAPTGTFSLVSGFEAGTQLVQEDAVTAVAFTGSQRGGLALWHLANERDVVIPVYAEMGTVNPVVVTAGGADRMGEVAAGFVASFTLGSGQFCTKPGLLLAPAGRGAVEAVAEALRAAAPAPVMLSQGIAHDVAGGIGQLQEAGAELVASVAGPGEGWSADAALLTARVDQLEAGGRLLEECFGPVALVVEYADRDELDRGIEALQGSLAGAVFGAGADDPEVAHAVAKLAGQAGRVTVGDWPTGVAWTWAQQHGGPWPATSHPAATSVGAAALDRFVRPVAFQSVPDAALPAPVREAVSEANPWRLPRRVDGRLELP